MKTGEYQISRELFERAQKRSRVDPKDDDWIEEE